MKTVFVGVNICKLHVWSSLCIFPLYVSEINDGQKRRRLEAPGVENQSPKPSNSGRIAELGIKADTPIVPSIFSRVQQLTQRREGRKHLNNGSKQTFEGFSFCVFTFYQFFWAVLSIRCYLYSLLTACDVLGAPPTQRCLSDPGSDSITSIHDQDVKAHLLGEYD